MCWADGVLRFSRSSLKILRMPVPGASALFVNISVSASLGKTSANACVGWRCPDWAHPGAESEFPGEGRVRGMFLLRCDDRLLRS